MYKLRVGLGNGMFEKLWFPLKREDATLVHAVMKHEIVISDKIIEYYMECNEDQQELITTWIEANGGTDFLSFYEEKEDVVSIEDEFERILSTVPFNMLLADDNELNSLNNSKKIKKYNGREALLKDSPLMMYTIPIANYTVSVGDKKKNYLDWFRNLISNESVVRIIDPYILSKSGVENLNINYIPIIPAGADIEIYSTDQHRESWTVEDLKKRIKSSGHSLNVYLLHRQEKHDRFIWAGDIKISIGRGLEFIHKKESQIQYETTISISEEPFKPINSAKKI